MLLAERIFQNGTHLLSGVCLDSVVILRFPAVSMEEVDFRRQLTCNTLRVIPYVDTKYYSISEAVILDFLN